MPDMHRVSSDSIDSIGYEDGNLYVRFKPRHATYKYFNVPEQIYKDMLSMSHPGRYLDKHVKKMGYEYTRV